ncbi:MAG: FAD binding domain-containing protein [Proteobacteria bacterium]|nr:FAD binding domain-containing protein [Pseudomonadota bacterium]MDA0845673.1 FAD binding domain-containing protein [Pseudomonadota bacterium]
MKSASFDYIRPDTLDAVCACLASHPDARIIAGGQSLVPMLAMRLARPSLVIDIAHIDGLSAIRDDDSAVVIGAMVRQAKALSDLLVATHLPLLAKALTHVGHPPTRARGTVGGSLVHADPSAEIPLVAVTLGASLRMRDAGEDVEFHAEEFFIGPMLTMTPPTACLFEISFAKPTCAYVGTGFHEVAARRSDYALAAAAAHIEADDAGVVQDLRLAIGGISDFPQRLPIDIHIDLSAGMADLGTSLTTAIDAALDDVDIVEDMHASASYRRRVAAELARRAVDDALREIAQDLS